MEAWESTDYDKTKYNSLFDEWEDLDTLAKLDLLKKHGFKRHAFLSNLLYGVGTEAEKQKSLQKEYKRIDDNYSRTYGNK